MTLRKLTEYEKEIVNKILKKYPDEKRSHIERIVITKPRFAQKVVNAPILTKEQKAANAKKEKESRIRNNKTAKYIEIPEVGFAGASQIKQNRDKSAKTISAVVARDIIANDPVFKKFIPITGNRKIKVCDISTAQYLLKWYAKRRPNGKTNQAKAARLWCDLSFGINSVGYVVDTSASRTESYCVILVNLEGGIIRPIAFDPLNGRSLNIRPEHKYRKGKSGYIVF